MKSIKTARDQKDSGLGFNGQAASSDSIYKYNAQYQTNKNDTVSNPDRINYGRGPTVGNKDTMAKPGRPDVAKVNFPFKNPDSINMGRGPRTPGGTENCAYPANPDMINVGRGPTKGNQQ